MRAAAILLALAAPAHAGCPDLTVLACEMPGGKRLEVCADDRAVTYAFGPPGAPELTLENPLAAPGYTPWPGVSRTIWESVAFRNGDYLYEVYNSAERIFPDDEKAEIEVRESAGVVILKGETVVAQVDCLPGTAEGPIEALYEHLEARGVCWDHAARAWGTCR